MPALTDTILQEFHENGVTISPVHAGRVQQLMEMYNFGAEEMVDEWLAFAMVNKIEDANSEEVMEMYSKAVKKSYEKEQRRKEKKMKKSAGVNQSPYQQQQGVQNNAILNAYLSTPNMKISSAGMENIKNMTSAIKNSPLQVTKSPFSPLQSPMYKLRTNAGNVAFSLVHDADHGKTEAIHWMKSQTDKRFKASLQSNTKQKEDYMFMKHVDLSNLQNDHVELASQEIRNLYEDEIEDYHPCNDPSHSQVTIVGRLTSECGTGKLTADSIVLEGCRTVSNGRRVKVDVSRIQHGSLFRGQIVAFSGSNPSGLKFLAEKAYTLKSRDGNVRVGKCGEVNSSGNVASVMVACGPFTTSDAISYEPLLDFIKKVKQSRPDMTIVIGPLLDEDHEHVRNGLLEDSLSKTSKKWLDFLKQEMSAYTQVVFVPSQKDAFHVPIYPQPPYQQNPQQQNTAGSAIFCPDPATLKLGDSPVSIGVTSVDVLMHMGPSEVTCKQMGGGPDRRLRLTSHLVDNLSYYPLHPPPPNFNLDLIKSEMSSKMTSVEGGSPPDVLIVPSDLRPFCKLHNGRLFLNPGRLSKGTSGGNYGHFLLDLGNPQNGVGCVAKIVKI